MKKFIYAILFSAPVLASAAITTPSNNLPGINKLVESVGNIFNNLIPVLFALAIVYFFWGLIEFLRSAGDPKAKELGQSHMIYGIIAITVMISIYGIVAWLAGTLDIDQRTDVELPHVEINP